MLLHVVPPSVEYSIVPPEPLTLPIDIEPPLTVQLLQVLLVMASVPVGVEGTVVVPVMVIDDVLGQPLTVTVTVYVLAVVSVLAAVEGVEPPLQL